MVPGGKSSTWNVIAEPTGQTFALQLPGVLVHVKNTFCGVSKGTPPSQDAVAGGAQTNESNQINAAANIDEGIRGRAFSIAIGLFRRISNFLEMRTLHSCRLHLNRFRKRWRRRHPNLRICVRQSLSEVGDIAGSD